ncbi:DASS family sodium-coupled anion symporter [Gulosibacter sp. 10]|uniref:SLC13 family permease n=1 Tax=Gulosibacter sp. 10 TaxID=1255570 RepID=UPI000B35DEDC|nr:DASS family sodium-coupled anion symporter [Gulosibacter sp. 10]
MSEPKVPDYLQKLKPDPNRGREIDFQSPGERAPGITKRSNTTRWIGFALGLVLALAAFFLLPQEMPHNARLTAATALLMACWWMSEALPIPATALMPLVIFPTLSEALPDEEGELVRIGFDSVGASYGNNVIFLFLGGFLLALSMQRWNLHRRIALLVLRVMPNKPGAMIGGFMIATGFLSMWVSNTATAVMMLPIGMSVLALVHQVTGQSPDAERGSTTREESAAVDIGAAIKSNFGTALMLGIAYAASLGSLGTLIGTPPNAFLAGYMSQNFDFTIGFGEWMIVGVPLSVVFLFIAWWLLVKVIFKPEMDEIPGGGELIRSELAKLGRMSRGEWLVLIVFAATATAWITIPLVASALDVEPWISDAGIAILAGVILFLTPAGANRGVKLLDWKSAKELPWDVLLLFGGGLALSAQFSDSGLTEAIGEFAAGMAGIPMILVIAILATAILFLTELTSNTATAATFVPVSAGIALGMGVDPLLFAAPVALAATCAFMLPVATPPNAVAYGSGYVTIPQMVRGGFLLNLIGIVLITITAVTLLTWVFGIVY